jgi:plasmid maintenance system antidote protein VapI
MNNITDEKGTTKDEARKLLINLRDEGFDGDNGKLALVLGITFDEILDFIDGDAEIGSDLLIKIRGIAQERNIEIE